MPDKKIQDIFSHEEYMHYAIYFDACNIDISTNLKPAIVKLDVAKTIFKALYSKVKDCFPDYPLSQALQKRQYNVLVKVFGITKKTTVDDELIEYIDMFYRKFKALRQTIKSKMNKK